jgi:hypothetical protein
MDPVFGCKREILAAREMRKLHSKELHDIVGYSASVIAF